MKLTQRLVDSIALPADRIEAIHYDDDLPGFGLRLRAGGSRTFVVAYKLGAKHRRMTLGTTAQLRLEAARKRAADILAAVRLGHDPAASRDEARARATDTIMPLVQRYLSFQKRHLRSKSYLTAEYQLLTQLAPFHALPLTAIDRKAVAQRLSEIATASGPAAADKSRAILSAFFGWAMREGLADANPVALTNHYDHSKGRERFLDESELVEVWHAAALAQPAVYGTILKLLILTGQRRQEIGSLRWPEIDFTSRLIRLPADRVKNATAHDVPLSEPALALLRAVPRRLNAHDGLPPRAASGAGASPSAVSIRPSTTLARLLGASPWRLGSSTTCAAPALPSWPNGWALPHMPSRPP
jgi:hypothetical protein